MVGLQEGAANARHTLDDVKGKFEKVASQMEGELQAVMDGLQRYRGSVVELRATITERAAGLVAAIEARRDAALAEVEAKSAKSIKRAETEAEALQSKVLEESLHLCIMW
jgi:multidrug resistance efflux pump